MSFTVDVHHHILPDFFWRETNDAHNPVGGIAPPPWNTDLMLSFMDEAGIDVAITSISTPGVHVGDDARARSLARRCNELSAELIQSHPSRLGGFAALPLPDVDGALVELEYALDELERRAAVVFVHPTASPDPSAHQLGLPDSLLDFTADTTRALAQMHYSNRFARTPSVKYIFSHAGGTAPYLAGRWGIVDEMNVIPGGEARGPVADTLRRLHWDTALSYRDPILRMLRDVVGMDQVLFGSDFPYIRRDLGVNCVQELEQTAEFTTDERTRAMSGNALQLFPRLGARAPKPPAS